MSGDKNDMDVIDVDAVEDTAPEHPGEITTASLVPVSRSVDPLMRPVATLDSTKAAFRDYQAMRAELLDPSDFQEAERGKQFVKKSGWRKLAVAMSVSDELVSRDYLRDEYGRVTNAEVTVRAIAPNGRFGEGLGVCDAHERCCPRAFGEKCTRGGRHHHCDEGCNGFTHFSKPQHDIPSTAHTRAKNRALSDLFGFGEVSAEEVAGGTHDGHGDDEPVGPAEGTEVSKIIDGLNMIPRENGARMNAKTKFVEMFGQPHELTNKQIAAATRFVTANGGKIAENTGTAESSQQGDPPARTQAAEDHDDTAPTPNRNHGEEAGAPAGEGPKEGTRHGARPSRPSPPPGDDPSTSTQRRTIGMAFADLYKKGRATEEDKHLLTRFITDGRTDTTTEASRMDCVKITTAVRLIQDGDLDFGDTATGTRGLLAMTPAGEAFLRPLMKERGMLPADAE